MHSKLWTDMFVLALPVAEKILRPVVVYFFLVIGLRLAGKRELAQLNPFDLVVLLTLSNTVQNAIIGDDNSVTGGIIGAATLLLVNYLVVRFLFRHEKLDRLVEGESSRIDRTRKDPAGTSWRRKCSRCRNCEAAAHKQGFGEPRGSGARHTRTERHDFLCREETGAGRNAPPGTSGTARSTHARSRHAAAGRKPLQRREFTVGK